MDVFTVGVIKCFLHNSKYSVVSISIKQNFFKQILLFWVLIFLFQKHIENELLRFVITRVHQYFNNTWWVFWIAISQQVLTDNLCNFFVYCLIFKINDFTYNIICKLIIYQFFNVIDDLINQSVFLWLTSCLETCLHYTAALLVSGYVETISDNGLVDWILVFIFGHYIKTCLDNMISVYVNWHVINVVFHRGW